MERLTDRKTAADLKSNYEGLRAAGQPRDIATERYIKLAEYENADEEMTGEWVYRDGKMGETWYCSLCGAPVVYDILEEPFLSKFCPKCGADMRGKENDES